MCSQRRWLIGPAFLLAFAVGCRSKSETKPATPSASVSAAALRLPAPKRHNWPAPTGPVLAVLAGRGVGPIRFGATAVTIERLMEAPCEVKTADVCRYPGRGIEFLLENGAAKTVHIYRAGRSAGKDKAGNEGEYGFFRGAIPPDLRLGMTPAAIEEHLGPPQRSERTERVGPHENAETHYYDGLTLLYDRLENGNLALAEMIVFKGQSVDAGAPPSAPSRKPEAARPAGKVKP